MHITIPAWLKDAAVDATERAIKTFAGGFIVGANLTGAVVNAALTEIDWQRGFDVGAGTLAISVLFSAASVKLGQSGTASATKAVVPTSIFKLVAGDRR
ncbi:holin [Mycobacteroides abscessus]|uniref:holin n=1 Tax=Mycobacteroides abscessus TaxID=36809 RepID=UPI0009A80B1E|nr:holin [Mycobacteroides abscessus]SLC02332.1 Uncharacterised protein [Mycobacteroides abscessus subsp. abscessus]SLG08452.1 Uncharacterised protein [Mycobacteroides abscessus subsp. abscessus]